MRAFSESIVRFPVVGRKELPREESHDLIEASGSEWRAEQRRREEERRGDVCWKAEDVWRSS